MVASPSRLSPRSGSHASRLSAESTAGIEGSFDGGTNSVIVSAVQTANTIPTETTPSARRLPGVSSS